MGINHIVKYFKAGNVCICGLIGRGKDMLMGNVIARLKEPYVSNTDYGGNRFPLEPSKIDCGGNTYENFISGDIKPYAYPYPDGTDIYIADAGVYFPSQYCNQLNNRYGYIATFMALSRHLGKCNVHFNVQNLNRVWDKIREMSDIYICTTGCVVLFGKFVIQRVIVYEKYQSAVDRVPPFWLPRPLLNPNRVFQWKVQKQNYDIAHGHIKSHILLYVNKAKYNTRIFKEMMEH